MPRNNSRSDFTKMSDDVLFDKLSVSDSVEDFADPSVTVKLLRLLITKQDASAKAVEANLATLTAKTNEHSSRLQRLETDFRDADQYSRKSVAIFTGLPKDSGETPGTLTGKVIETLNEALGPNQDRLCLKDFVAIHRNGLNGHNGKPPSITLKFLRYFEKELFFTKNAKKYLRERGLNIFHALSPGFIREQDKIKNHNAVKYVTYDGPGRHFSVCLTTGKFINRVTCANDFLSKLNDIDATD